jgi:hypothetical protein
MSARRGVRGVHVIQETGFHSPEFRHLHGENVSGICLLTRRTARPERVYSLTNLAKREEYRLGFLQYA